MIDQRRGIDQAAVHVAGERRLGEPRTDARGNVRHGHGVIELLLRAVRQGYYGHGRILQVLARARADLGQTVDLAGLNDAGGLAV